MATCRIGIRKFIKTLFIFSAAVLISIPMQSPSAFADQRSGGIQTKIVGGDPINISNTPWQVALIDKGESHTNDFNGQYCGGSIISRYWIVTAAHCVVGVDNLEDEQYILAGTSTLLISGFSPDLIHVAQIFPHPDYDSITYDDDIALLKLETPLELNSTSIKSIAIATSSPKAGLVGTVSGWGQLLNSDGTDFYLPNGNLSDASYPLVLHGADVTVQTSKDSKYNFDCYDLFKNASVQISKKSFCASGYEMSPDGPYISTDTCQGDSGGPLASYINGNWTLVGITSWGSGCAWLFPGVYTNVANYKSWIVANALEPGVAATFSEPSATSDGFTVNVENYSPDFKYKASIVAPGKGRAKIGKSMMSDGNLVLPITVTGADPSSLVKLRVEVSRSGYTTVPSEIEEQVLDPFAAIPKFSKPVSTADGFTINIQNYSPLFTYDLSTDSLTVLAEAGTISGSVMQVIVTNLDPGVSTTLSVDVSAPGYRTSNKTVSGQALNEGRAPIFSEPISTADSFSFLITNYLSGFKYKVSIVSPGKGTVKVGKAIGSDLPVTVSKLSPGTVLEVNVVVTKKGCATYSDTVEGRSFA